MDEGKAAELLSDAGYSHLPTSDYFEYQPHIRPLARYPSFLSGQYPYIRPPNQKYSFRHIQIAVLIEMESLKEV